jgi:transposase
VALDSTHVKAHRCAGGGKGASEQAIGVTRGGRNSKLHALVDKLCRPWVIILTPGNVADCTVGPECVSPIAGVKKLLGDKAYDSDAFRKSLRQDGITPVIPGRANRKKRIRHDKDASPVGRVRSILRASLRRMARFSGPLTFAWSALVDSNERCLGKHMLARLAFDIQGGRLFAKL